MMTSERGGMSMVVASADLAKAAIEKPTGADCFSYHRTSLQVSDALERDVVGVGGAKVRQNQWSDQSIPSGNHMKNY